MSELRPATSRRLCAGALALTTLALAGCGGAADAASSSPDAPAVRATTGSADSTTYPLALQVPGQTQPVTLQSEPQRIAVLSPDAATAVDELIGTDRIVAIPNTSLREELSVRADDFSEVPHVIPDGTDPDPEQILSWDPDLVIVTARHAGEQEASSQLTAAGVPVLTLTNNWDTVQAVADNIELIGTAVNAQAQAARLVAQIADGVQQITERLAEVTSRPSVLILSNQSSQPFVNATNGLVSELVSLVGGVNAAPAAGVQNTGPASPEQIVKADPDKIMLIDVLGKGESSFSDLLDNPAVAALPAVANGDVRMFDAKNIFGIGGVELVDGLQQIASWLHPEQF